MSLIATLKRIETEGSGLSNDKRPAIVDGSLSEIITQALNVARARKDFYTDEPYFGKANPEVPIPDGGGTVTNIKREDEPYNLPIRPSLETQAMDSALVSQVAEQFGDEIVDAADENARNQIHGRPVMIYAIPETGQVTEEMNADITDYVECGAVGMSDFVFVFTDHASLDGDSSVVDVNQKVTDYEKAGAKVYRDLQSFLGDLPDITKKR